LRALANARPDAKRVVLLTPAERGGLAVLKQIGFESYLVKPVRAASLAAVLGSPAAPDTAEVEPPIVESPPLAATAGAADALSVLIAEDNEINALLARSLLGKLGHRVTVAVDGEQACAQWQAARAAAAPFDLVLMDTQMPGLDGVAAARRIRALEATSGTPRTPIFALTATVSAEDRAACLAAGMDGFLAKPLDRDELADHLAVLSRRSQAA
jgi:CheY-like chemotaxis protein